MTLSISLATFETLVWRRRLRGRKYWVTQRIAYVYALLDLTSVDDLSLAQCRRQYFLRRHSRLEVMNSVCNSSNPGLCR